MKNPCYTCQIKTGISDLDYRDDSAQLFTTKSNEEKANVLGKFSAALIIQENQIERSPNWTIH